MKRLTRLYLKILMSSSFKIACLSGIVTAPDDRMILMVCSPDFISFFQACFDHIIRRRQTHKDGIEAMGLQTLKPLG